jgi:uncharacterized protein (TIGR02646 family)
VRRIKKRSEPSELGEWRASAQTDANETGINFGYDALRQNTATVTAVTVALIAEQGALCAYTGRRIASDQTHIEHLMPQVHCSRGEDVDYTNLVACWPAPNHASEPAYGARRKGSWPAPNQRALFVSPLSSGCEERFRFNLKGEISAATTTDTAAQETINKLNLGDPELERLRKSSIDGALSPRRPQKLSIAETRKLLREIDRATSDLNDGSNVSLRPYCFVIRQAMEKHLKRLAAIQQQGG